MPYSDTAMNYLKTGNVFDSFFQAMYESGINQTMFFSIFLMLGAGFMYMRNKDIGLLSLSLLFAGTSIGSSIMPETYLYIQLIMFFGVVGLLYKVIKGGK